MEVLLLNIAIQNGLEDLKQQLEIQGHNVFYIGEKQSADAILYKDLNNYPFFAANNIPSTTSSIGGNMVYGALLINVVNKSVDEIAGILNRRLYSPLF
jgi:hypothetical protein